MEPTHEPRDAAGGGAAEPPALPSHEMQAPAPNAGSSPTGIVISLWVAIGIVSAIGHKAVFEAAPELGAWVQAHLPWVVLGFLLGGVLAVGAANVPAVGSWLRRQSAAAKSTFAAAMLIPCIILVLMVPFLPPAWRVLLVHMAFVLILCLLPGLVYYLFIISRRPSMLNEYVATLTRLRLIGPASADPAEGDSARRRRIESYVQRFEAVYGPITDRREALLDELTGTDDAGRAGSIGSLAYGSARPGDLTHVFPREVLVQLFVTTILLALGWLLILPPILPEAAYVGPTPGSGAATGGHAVLVPALSPVNMAFIGAYFFSLQMVFRRFVRRDLTVKVYVNICVRIALAVLAAWVVTVLWAVTGAGELNMYGLLTAGFDTVSGRDSGVLLLAFACGVFPRTLWQLLVSAVKRLPPVRHSLPSLEPDQPLSLLDGVTVWHEARLEEEDVENVPNLATADPLELILQTRFPAERVMVWMDQAILLSYLKDPAGPAGAQGPSPRERFRAMGIGSATDLLVNYDGAGAEELEAVFGDLAPTARHILASLRGRKSNFALLRAWFRPDPVHDGGAHTAAEPAMRPDTAGPDVAEVAEGARWVAGA